MILLFDKASHRARKSDRQTTIRADSDCTAKTFLFPQSKIYSCFGIICNKVEIRPGEQKAIGGNGC